MAIFWLSAIRRLSQVTRHAALRSVCAVCPGEFPPLTSACRKMSGIGALSPAIGKYVIHYYGKVACNARYYWLVSNYRVSPIGASSIHDPAMIKGSAVIPPRRPSRSRRAGHYVPLAAAAAAVGGGVGRHVPGEPAAVVHGGGRAGDVHRRGPGDPGDPGGTAGTAAAATGRAVGLNNDFVRGSRPASASWASRTVGGAPALPARGPGLDGGRVRTARFRGSGL